MQEIFQYLKPSQIAMISGMTPVRFSQKLHGHKVKGVEQKFSETELQRVKNNLIILANEIVNVVQKA